jgi:hypothetical protein
VDEPPRRRYQLEAVEKVSPEGSEAQILVRPGFCDVRISTGTELAD